MSNPEDKNKALFILNPKAGVPPVNFIVSKDLDRRKHELTCLKSMCVLTSTQFYPCFVI